MLVQMSVDSLRKKAHHNVHTFLYVKDHTKLREQKHVLGSRHLSTDVHYQKELCSRLGQLNYQKKKGEITIITNKTWLFKNTVCPESDFLGFHPSTPVLKSDLYWAVDLSFARNPTQNWKHWESVLSTRSELLLPHLGSRNLQMACSPALGKEIPHFRTPLRSSKGFQITEYWVWRLMNFCETEEPAGSSLEKPHWVCNGSNLKILGPSNHQPSHFLFNVSNEKKKNQTPDFFHSYRTHFPSKA